MQLTWWGLWQPLGAQSSDDRALNRQVEHQYRVEPEEDARSEGTQDSREAAPGRLAALDIDLEDRKKNKKQKKECCLPHRATKMGQSILGS